MRHTGRSSLRALAALLAAAVPGVALADGAPPAPYSLPWQLRPAAPGTVTRLDSALALSKDAAGNAGESFVSLLFVSYKVLPELAPFVRLGLVQASPPGATEGGLSLSNLALGAMYGLKTADFKLSATLGVALPIGMGGGDSPDAVAAATTRSGILARSGLDNVMFAVNDLVIFPGIDLAYVAHGFTAQLELTLLELIRVRGANAQPDETKTNLTMGLHLGYFFIPELSLGAELRYQRWLSTPAAVAKDTSGASRDNLTMAAGLRVHLKLGDTIWARPGLAYARGLDDPMSAGGYNIVQLDLPVSY